MSWSAQASAVLGPPLPWDSVPRGPDPGLLASIPVVPCGEGPLTACRARCAGVPGPGASRWEHPGRHPGPECRSLRPALRGPAPCQAPWRVPSPDQGSPIPGSERRTCRRGPCVRAPPPAVRWGHPPLGPRPVIHPEPAPGEQAGPPAAGPRRGCVAAPLHPGGPGNAGRPACAAGPWPLCSARTGPWEDLGSCGHAGDRPGGQRGPCANAHNAPAGRSPCFQSSSGGHRGRSPPKRPGRCPRPPLGLMLRDKMQDARHPRGRNDVCLGFPHGDSLCRSCI